WIAGEMKQPQRDLPRALLIGISLLTLIYVVVNLAYLYALPLSQLKGVSRVAEAAATALVGINGARLVAFTVVVSTFGCDAAAILAGARLLFSMVLDGVFFLAGAMDTSVLRSHHVVVVAL